MIKEERFIMIFDEGDWILDTQTEVYISFEEACDMLNDYDEQVMMVADFCRMIDEAYKED